MLVGHVIFIVVIGCGLYFMIKDYLYARRFEEQERALRALYTELTR
jgi:hypothetical protein